MQAQVGNSKDTYDIDTNPMDCTSPDVWKPDQSGGKNERNCFSVIVAILVPSQVYGVDPCLQVAE